MIGRIVNPTVLAALTQSPQRVGAFVELDWPGGWVRVHTGLGERSYNGQTYYGVGELGGIGRLVENASTSANRLKLTLKVLDQLLLAQALSDDVNGRDCYMHLVAYDENRRIIGGQDYFYDGKMVDAQIKRGVPEKQIPAIISVTCSDWFERWAQAPNPARITDAAQQDLYPSDQIFDQVEIIAGSPLHSLPFKSYASGGRGGGYYRGGRGGGPGDRVQ